MSSWEKFTEDFRKGVSALSDKTAELVKEGAEKTAATATYTTKMVQMNLERKKFERKMESEWTALGKLFCTLHAGGKLKDFKGASKANLNQLQALQSEIEKIEAEKEVWQKKYVVEGIDKAKVKDLTTELEESGGTIEQMTLAAGAPAVGKKLKDVILPKEALIGTIFRGDDVIIPDGSTTFQKGDKITLLGKTDAVEKAISDLGGK